MNKLTVGNVTANDGKMVFAYFTAIFIIPLFSCAALLYYKKSKNKSLNLHEREFDDVALSEHSVLVTNLPKNMGAYALESEITKVFSKIFKGKNLKKSPLVRCRVLGQSDSVFEMCKDVENHKILLEKALYVKERDGVRMTHQISSFPMIWCCKTEADTEDYCREKIDKI
jgi:hypothetical protein